MQVPLDPPTLGISRIDGSGAGLGKVLDALDEHLASRPAEQRHGERPVEQRDDPRRGRHGEHERRAEQHGEDHDARRLGRHPERSEGYEGAEDRRGDAHEPRDEERRDEGAEDEHAQPDETVVDQRLPERCRREGRLDVRHET